MANWRRSILSARLRSGGPTDDLGRAHARSLRVSCSAHPLGKIQAAVDHSGSRRRTRDGPVRAVRSLELSSCLCENRSELRASSFPHDPIFFADRNKVFAAGNLPRQARFGSSKAKTDTQVGFRRARVLFQVDQYDAPLTWRKRIARDRCEPPGIGAYCSMRTVAG